MQNVGDYAQAPTFQTQRWRVKASALAPNCRRFDTLRRKRLSSRHLGQHPREAALDNSDALLRLSLAHLRRAARRDQGASRACYFRRRQ